ncbi:hypothetical protein [Brasilonema sp. UFV-L1]|uniref:hypothetical protein n=1 Tax=Brasilonema sp. UFV-L1 TaxID=2234130 RepID=UPI001B7CE7E6|nr:hypothetical protein [Brasilonema sp. UFV-L1]
MIHLDQSIVNYELSVISYQLPVISLKKNSEYRIQYSEGRNKELRLLTTDVTTPERQVLYAGGPVHRTGSS